MQINILHSYYEVGGEQTSNRLYSIESDINDLVPSFAIARTVEGPQIADKELVVTLAHSVRAQSVLAARSLDVDDLKQTLFFLSGPTRGVQFVNSRLHHNPHSRFVEKGESNSGVPWGNEGLVTYLNKRFDINQLAFSGLKFVYKGLDKTGTPYGDIRFVLGKDTPENKEFFEAQTVCYKALKSIIGGKLNIETPHSMMMGRVKLKHAQKNRVERVVAKIGSGLAENPVVFDTTKLNLKHKTQEDRRA